MHAVYAAGQILVIGSLSGEVGLPMRTAYALPPSSREARTTLHAPAHVAFAPCVHESNCPMGMCAEVSRAGAIV